MNLRRTLSAFARVIADEVERNPDFASRVAEALWNGEALHRTRKVGGEPTPRPEAKRGAHRRALPTIDPISLARQGEGMLRQELGKLTLEQLHDVVAGYGMDTGKLVMKWKSPERVVDRIVEVSLSRAQKGNAFRSAAIDPESTGE
jgi:hypothetical protein